MNAMMLRAALVLAAAMVPARATQTRSNGASGVTGSSLRAHAGEAVEVRVSGEKALERASVTSEGLGWKGVAMGHHTRGGDTEMGALPMVPAGAPKGTYRFHVDGMQRDGRALSVDGTITVE